MDRERVRRRGAGAQPSEHAPVDPGKRTRVEAAYPTLARAMPAAGDTPPSIHDAATAAVEHKGSGGALDGGVAARVGGHLGVDFGGVRVHQDAMATEASAAMGARAFAHGADVFLGAGESGSDLGLMAHELTHVAQQGAAGQRTPQRKVEVGDANSPAEHEADAVAAAVTRGEAPGALLVDDGPVAPGQMLKSTFVALLRAQVTVAADAELGPVYSAIGCPYIDQYFGRYSGRPARDGEALLRRFAPATRTARSAADMIPLVVDRVRDGVRQWRDTGEAPPELAAADAGAARAAAATATPPGTAAGKIAALGDGQALDPTTAARMGAAFDQDFSGVVVHTGAGAARLAADEGARALAVGQHIGFAAGSYQPGTHEGDALLAHELTHTLQQRGADTASALRAPLPGDSSGAEADADRAAPGVLQRLYGTARAGLASVSSTFNDGLRLSRCSSPSTAPAPAPAPPTTAPAPPAPAPAPPAPAPAPRPPDLHAGTGLPAAADQAVIQSELNPTTSSAPGVAPAMWDAHSTAAGTAAQRSARRATLTRELNVAMTAHLAAVAPTMRTRSTTRQIPMSSWQGVGRAAKRVADAMFGSWTAGAALTPTIEAARAHQDFDPGTGPGAQTLFNAWDPTERARAGAAIDPEDLASWMLDTDDDAQAAMQRHHFDPHRDAVADPAREERLFIDSYIHTFAAAHRADLERYDQFDFAITDRETGRIAMFPGVDESESDVAPAGGISPAERHARWAGFKTLVHEYFHTLEHATFNAATLGRRVMVEGFCELFTKDVLHPDVAGAAGNAALRTEVEGGTYPVDLASIGGYSAGSYADYLGHAERIRDHAPGGANAVRAAFFQGHVELIGLSTAGTALGAAALAERDSVAVPLGVTDIAGLAAASGVAEADIRTANPALAAPGAPLPARVALPGCREHRVASTADSSGAHRTEHAAEIAAQNGVLAADLTRANPGVADWNALTAGQRILIPRH